MDSNRAPQNHAYKAALNAGILSTIEQSKLWLLSKYSLAFGVRQLSPKGVKSSLKKLEN